MTTGCCSRIIVAALFVTHRAASTYIGCIVAKLGAGTCTEAGAGAIRHSFA